jgi:hypothetical protein
MPREAPVIKTVFPLNDMAIILGKEDNKGSATATKNL